MAALDQILTALAGRGWGMTRDDGQVTRWDRANVGAHAQQTVGITWTAHRPPRMHHAWVTVIDTNGDLSDARFDDVPTLLKYLEEL